MQPRPSAACPSAMRGLLVFATACVGAIEPIGGTPGPPSIACADGDDVCRGVSGALEMRRRNIGGWCGTPNLRAFIDADDYGRAALPHLARAFDDRDPEVAMFAMHVAVAIGDRESVEDWCRGVSDRYRIAMCRAGLGVDRQARL